MYDFVLIAVIVLCWATIKVNWHHVQNLAAQRAIHKVACGRCWKS